MRSQSYLKLLGGSQFPPLPETQAQVEAIAQILEAPNESDALQLGKDASRATVFVFNTLQRLSDYQYLVFATHGVLPGEVNYIQQPALVLSYPEKNGYLTMADVFGLKLNAKLVVLSACNTGRGEQIRGEGIMGLTRAFMYAGTPAVEVTLWSVDSKASYEINTRFFELLKKGQTVAVALRQAKLDLLKAAAEDEDKEHFRHPFFWAPFVVFGDGSGGNLRQYQQALEYHKQALVITREVGDRSAEGISLDNIGVVYAGVGQYQQALEYHKQALAIYREIDDRSGEGSALGNIGLVYAVLGQYQQALGYHEQALAIYREIGDRSREGSALGNIGLVYTDLGQYQRALEYSEQALAIARQLGEQNEEGKALTNIGVIYKNLGQYQRALEYSEQVLEIARKLSDQRAEGLSLSNIGEVYTNLGQYERALDYFEQALKIAYEIGDRHGEGVSLSSIGEVYTNLGQHPKAYTAFQDSVTIFEMLGTLDSLWLAQRGLASIEVNLNQPESAISHYEQALNTIEHLLAGLTEQEHKLSFMRGKLYIYNEMISLLSDLHQKHPDKGYDRKALAIFERKQGRIFLEEMGQSGARLFAGISEAISQRKLDLELQLEQTRRQLIDERLKMITDQNKELIQNLEEREKILLTDQERLQAQIKTDYPDYYALRYPRPVALPELQQHVLKSGELMLVYGVIEEQTVLWVISNHDLSFVTLDISEEELQKAVEAFRTAPNAIIETVSRNLHLKAIRLVYETLDEMIQQGYTLYQQLFPKSIHSLVTKAQMLYIVPTDSLYGLPFEALVTEIPKPGEQPHYLVQNHSIAYLSSTSLLKILRDAQARRKQTTKYPLLAFANPVYDSSHFLSLPESEEEARAIAAIVEVPEESEPLQLREKASRSNLLRLNMQERLDDYRYLLFSVHAVLPGEVDHINQPALVLSHPEQNGYLTMADVYGLQLNADLVVLSAGNTGRGEYIEGEGIMGLTRAFMYAGTPAVGVTLWSVDSQASYEINTRFFRHLKDGKPVAKALRQAKLDLLAIAEDDEDMEHFKHPFFWAPFVVFGDGM